MSENEELLQLLENPPGELMMKANLAALGMKLAQLAKHLKDQNPDWAAVCIAASDTFRVILRDGDAWPPVYQALMRAGEAERLRRSKAS